MKHLRFTGGRLGLLLAFGLLAFLPSHAARATTYTVTDTSDSATDTGSLRYAVGQAVNGDTINITATGDVAEGGTLTIAHGVTINGPSASAGTFVLAGGLNGYGVMEISSSSAVTISNVTLTDSLDNNSGGGLLVDSGATATLNGCTITGNGAPTGGGIYNLGTLTLTNCTISGNDAPTNNGGGIDNAGILNLTDCSVSQNDAGPNTNDSGSGGGLYNEATGTATITDSSLSGNAASASGGAVSDLGTVTLVNCTLYSDTAGTSGGALDNVGTATVTNCSFSTNTAPTNGGGAVSDEGGSTTLTNDILYGDTGGEVFVVAPVTAKYCDIGESIASDGVTDDGHNVNDNAGTPDGADPAYAFPPSDLHLAAGSPCLGKGTATYAPSTDFDGFTRPSPPSIGAYDAPQDTLTVNNTTDTGLASGSLGVNLSDATSLRAAVAYANDYIDDAITFDPTVFTASTVITETQGPFSLAAPMSIGEDGTNVTISGNNEDAVFTIDGGTAESPITLTNITAEDAASTYDYLFDEYLGGSGIVVNSGAFASLTDCTCANDSSEVDGGGGLANAGTTTLTNCNFSDDTAPDGLGAYNSGTLTATGCNFSSNTTTNSVGAGFDNAGGTASLTDCTFSNNNAGGGGAGIYNLAILTLTNCVVQNNTAGTVDNPAPGGGVYNDSNTSPGATTVIVNCTFTGNDGTNGGGAIASYGGVILVNDILFGDTGGEIANADAGDTVAAYCDINDDMATDGTTNDGGNTNEDPEFIGLVPYGENVVDSGATQAEANALDLGTITIPIFDITGALRHSPPTMGAYENTGASGGTTTTTTLTSPTAPASYTTAQSVPLAATVSPSTATGSVTFTITPLSGSPVTETGTLSSGTATATVPAGTLAAGSYTITASYGGDSNDNGSATASSTSLTVTAASAPVDTTTTLTSPVASASYTTAQSIPLAATVSPSTATGNVTFTFTSMTDATTAETATVSVGSATSSLPAGTLAAGSYEVSASYGGDSGDYGSTSSPAIVVTITASGAPAPVDTTTTLTSPTAPASYTTAQSIPLAATVSPSTATGSVTFTITPSSGSALTETGTLSDGTATATVPASTLAAGSYTVTASYGGDDSDNPSASSPALALTVTSPSLTTTTTTLTSPTSPASYTTAQSIPLAATVSPSTATGSVTFTITPSSGSAVTETGTLSDGTATATVPASTLAAGSYTVTASYGGDDSDNPSMSSPALALTVTSPSLTTTTTTLTSPTSPASYTTAQSIPLAATVSPSTATGSVTFTITPSSGSTVTETGTLSDGTATATVPASTLAAGSYTVTASYGGDDSDNPSASSPALALTVTSPAASVIATFNPGWQMVCFDETYGDFEDALNGATPPTYFTYNGSNYVPFNSLTEAAPTPGMAFWVNPSSGSTVSVYNTGSAVSTVHLPLSQGWNMIGDPFAGPNGFPLSDISVTSSQGNTVTGMRAANSAGLLYSTLYTWTTTNTTAYTIVNGLSDGATLSPLTGYWLYAFQSGETLTMTVSA